MADRSVPSPARDRAVQAAVNAIAVYTQTINDYGRHSAEAEAAHEVAKQKTLDARALGATDADLLATRPA
ncbi:hypothetical protein ACWD0Z_06370 [Streptomyces sp. NPDC003007]